MQAAAFAADAKANRLRDIRDTKYTPSSIYPNMLSSPHALDNAYMSSSALGTQS